MFGTAYLVFEYVKYQRDYREIPQDTDTSYRFNATAEHFDEDLDSGEFFLGINRQRKKLIQTAWGNVLEVGVGTGRNGEFYDLTKVKSLSLVDQSPQMIDVARAKWKETHPEYMNVSFETQSALEALPVPSVTQKDAGKGYDTIVSTMSLCSIPHPSLLIRHLGMHLNSRSMVNSFPVSTKSSLGEKIGFSSKPIIDSTSRILLLEHGRSHYSLVNWLLDRAAVGHALKHGCWWNRDIGKIVEDSGMEVVRVQRKHLGTTWIFELKLPEMNKEEQSKFQQVYEEKMNKMKENLPKEKAESELLWKSVDDRMDRKRRIEDWKDKLTDNTRNNLGVEPAKKKKEREKKVETGTIWDEVK